MHEEDTMRRDTSSPGSLSPHPRPTARPPPHSRPPEAVTQLRRATVRERRDLESGGGDRSRGSDV